jgi:hypothetical protein
MNGGGITSIGPLTLINTTVSANATTGVPGGGGVLVALNPATITNSTISGNSAPAGTGGGIALLGGVSTTLKNTIVADNTAASSATANCVGSPTSLGHNLESSNTCGFRPALQDLVNADPLLGPLQKNGGPTPTQALQSGSPAIDAGDNVGCPATDQRGTPRPLDGISPAFGPTR